MKPVGAPKYAGQGLSTEPPPDIYQAESEIRALDIPTHPEPEVTIVVPTYRAASHNLHLPKEHRGEHRRAGL